MATDPLDLQVEQLKALANLNRLLIYRMLERTKGGLTQQEIMTELRISQPYVSQSLRCLKLALLVTPLERKRVVRYVSRPATWLRIA